MLSASRMILPLGVIIFALLLAACGGSATATPRPAPTAVPAPTAAPTAVPAPTAMPAATEIPALGVGELNWAKPSPAAMAKFANAKQGGTLIVGLKSPIGGLDPDINQSGNGHQVIVNVYEGFWNETGSTLRRLDSTNPLWLVHLVWPKQSGMKTPP